LIWVYYSSLILFTGAEITQVYANRYGRGIVPSRNAVPITEAERASQGIPHSETLAAMAKGKASTTGASPGRPQPAVASQPQRTLTPPTIPSPLMPATSPSVYAAAAGGLAVGIAAGAVGALSRMNDPKRPMRKHLQAVKLNERLERIEQRVGNVRAINDAGRQLDLVERVEKIEDRIRKTARDIHASTSSKPEWVTRFADWARGR
jgi:hypothetical protein